MLKNGTSSYVNDKNMIEYAVKRTFNRENAWDTVDNDFEHLDSLHNDLVCYISKNHKNTIDYDKMKEILGAI